MFEKFRRPGRSYKEGKIKKWFSYFIFGSICMVFVFLAPMGTQLIGVGVLGYVGNEPIRAEEVRLVEDNIRQQYQSQLEQADEKRYSEIQQEIQQRALQYLMEISLLVQATQNQGFFLSDEELRSKIRSFPFFHQDGRFLYSYYLSFLKNQKLSPARFEERIRKVQMAENWREIFKKSLFSNSLEHEKKSQRHSYKVSFRYALFNVGDIEESDLESLVKAKKLKKINQFLKQHKVEWQKTGVFSLFSAFGIPIANNQNVKEVLIHHLPSKGIIPRLIWQGDKIYVVQVLFFKKTKKYNQKDMQLESFLEKNYNKSLRILDLWMQVQRQKIKIRHTKPDKA